LNESQNYGLKVGFDKPSGQMSPETKGNQWRHGTLSKFTGEGDEIAMPMTKNPMDWRAFNTDLWSTDRDYEEVADICAMNRNKLVDLRPYLIEEPFFVTTMDKLPKVLDLFRSFHLRALPVIDPNNGMPVAVLTR
jgi:hypothetical protein